MNSNTKNVLFSMLRSLLFVPVLNEKFVAAAHARGADGIILDLEDSIVADRKTAAREALHAATGSIRQHKMPVVVRVNNQAELLQDDLRAAVLAGADAIMIPKIETVEVLQQADQCIVRFEDEAKRPVGSVKCVPLLETPRAIVNIAGIVGSSERLCALAFGSEDFAALLGVEPVPSALSMPAQSVALVARAYDLAAWGLPGSIGDFKNESAFFDLACSSKSLGFTGAMAIHPKQVELINSAFRPASRDLEWAHQVVEAYEKGQKEGAGAVKLEGTMIDAPVVERARRLLGL